MSEISDKKGNKSHRSQNKSGVSMQQDSEANSLASSGQQILTRKQRLSNWLWLDNQHAFREESQIPGVVKDPQLIRYLRGINLFISLFDYAIQIGTNLQTFERFARNYKFFTIWGMTFTLVTNILAQFQYPGRHRELETDKYSPWRVWKWHTVCFEMSLFFEMIVVPYFWTALFPLELADWDNKSWSQKFLGVGDHTLPFLTLVIEFIFLSGTPFIARHFVIAGGLGWVYLWFNCIYTITTGTLIYPPFKWNSVGQFIGLPVGFTLGGAFVFFLAFFLCKLKLHCLGHNKIYNVLYGAKKQEQIKVFIK